MVYGVAWAGQSVLDTKLLKSLRVETRARSSQQKPQASLPRGNGVEVS